MVIKQVDPDLDHAWAEFDGMYWEDNQRNTFLDFIPDWHYRSACGDLSDADLLFFGEETTEIRPALGRGAVRDARKVCDGCPVKRECLTHALSTPEKYGIWAGTTGRGRVAILKMMREGSVSLDVMVEQVLSLSGRPR